MENNKTPSIRFKGFTDPWEQRKLGDIVGIYDGVHQTPKYQDNGIMFLSVENIATLKSTKYVSEEDFKRDYKVYPQENDILMTRIGDVGTTNVVTDNGLKAYYVSLALLKYKNTNPYFLSNAIQSNYVQKGLANRTLKTAIPMKINKDEIGKVDVILPTSVEEQAKIGDYFKSLDTLITPHQRKHNKLLNVKKSMLEKMFPKNGSNIPEIRFKGFTDPWEQRKLGDIGIAKSGVGFPDVEQGGSKGTPFFKVSDMNTDGNENELVIANNYVTDEQISRKRWNVVTDVPAIFFAKVGAAVMLNRKRLVRFPFLLDNNTMAYIFDKEVWDCDFGKTLFETIDLTKLTQLGALPSYNSSDVEEIEIYIPLKVEQKCIGSYFKQLDNLITLHQRELEKLQNIKKSMLEKMFV